LQENVWAADAFESTASMEDYGKTVKVDWEILPPGKIDNVMTKMLMGKGPITDTERKQMKARLEGMAKLEPKAYIAGASGFARYFGAMFEDDLVAFENLEYGNALYVMYEDWATLSQRSRTELLKGPSEGFERILHTKGWETQLVGCIQARRNEGA
jgi:hypothetical protein